MGTAEEVVKMLVGGFGMGWGPCLAVWGPILLPYIAARGGGWQQGLKISALFSLGRVVALAILGALSTVVFAWINSFFPPHRASYLYLAVGLFVLLVGILIVLGKQSRMPIQAVLRKRLVDAGGQSGLLLGFLIGIAPCYPLVAVLTYIACAATNVLSGILYAVSFAIGTIVPVLLLGTLAGFVPDRLIASARQRRIFGVVCGGVLILFGAHILYSVAQMLG